ncbi:DNA-binding protein RFX2-like [Teleopsis dalmanni]|uniref:DNA-binding protein RFX2-like n=1 Tax=Teleopsis dalmanni TaxID=139649 RepID=UPI0018CF01BC|nr:DNA-binding protein RFX2-like [Teleopsis dalmanni]
MTTRLATQRNFLLRTPTAVATSAGRSTIILDSSTDSPEIISADDVADLATETILTSSHIKNEEIAIETATSDSQNAEFSYLDEDAVVAAAHLEDVMTQQIKNTGDPEGVAIISVVVPMEATDSNSETSANISDLSAIKDNVNLTQVANGQVTLMQAQPSESDDATTQYITVTVSAQDAGPNYQVQYVDSEIYHSNSSQTQMTYPFCPVGDYQTNGQTYYATTTSGNYGTTSTNTPTTHTSTLPYLVPVEETLLLNSSSQSHSQDSPHSLTEVTYLHEAHSKPQTPTSTTTTNSLSGGSIGTGGGGASPESEQNTLGNTNKIASATIKWLSRNYETAEGVSLPRSTLYNHYMQHCNENKLEPVNAASFGKLIRSVFSGLRTRRLGTRGNSKYHYYGIRIKPGSMLVDVMDEKISYQLQSSSSNAVNSGTVMSSGSTMNSTRSSKKNIIKPESYEACAQYLGNGAGVLPTFPPIELDNTFNSELTQDDVETFRAMYRDHCEAFLDAVVSLEFNTIELVWRDFWRSSDNNNMDECDEEKYLSKTKLYLLFHCVEIHKFIQEVDYQFYQNMVDVIIPDVLRSIPNALTQAIRNFAKNMELWLCESMAGIPERLVQIKTSTVSAFCQTLRRYTSLNHLAQAARAVLQNSSQISQMLNDLNRVDFRNVQEQASWVCQCETGLVQRLENDFKAALQQQSTLEQWAAWLQLAVDTALEDYHGKPSYPKAARQFLLNWSFYSSMIIRDLTLRSASSFGSFHLIRLLYDEYMFYLVEHKIAEAQQKTAIAVICDRLVSFQKDVDFDFDYQLDFINNSNINPNHVAKRLKSE